MKILLVTDERGNEIITGGGLNHLLYVLRPATALGHSVEFITADEYRGRMTSPERKKELMEKLENKIKEFQPDIINMFNNCIWGFEPYEIADRYGIPTVLTVPDYMLICKARMIYKIKEKESCKRDGTECFKCPNYRTGIKEDEDIFGIMKDRRIIVGSDFMKMVLLEKGYKDENVNMIEYGLNPDAYKPSYGGNSGFMLNISRMSPEKGLEMYVDLASKNQNLKWILAGYPPMDINSPFFDYLGPISESDKMYYMKNMEIFVSTPRWHEPIGGTYLESKALGKPIVTFRRGGIPQYHEGNGSILIDYPNLDAMGEAIQMLHKDEELRIKLGKEGRKHSYSPNP